MAENSAGPILIGIPIYQNHVTTSKEAFMYEKRQSIDKSLICEVSPSSSIRSPIEDVLEKLIRFLTSDLITKLITSKRTFYEGLCRMAVDNVLNSKVEIGLAFCLILVLFNLVTIGK